MGSGTREGAIYMSLGIVPPGHRYATGPQPGPVEAARPAAPVLVVHGISKAFGAVRALSEMSFELRPGEVHVLFGENGAGKSTLVNIVAGAFPADSGEIRVLGEPVRFRDVHEARAHGVAAMFQEFSVAPHLSVEENVLLGAEPRTGIWLKRAERRRIVEDALRRFGFALDPKAIVLSLSRGEQQMVEMTKALLIAPRILILDEPTASLSERETETMFGLVRKLRAEGVGIIYITHRIREIREIADRVTVMRDGRFIATVDARRTDQKQLVELMTGRSFDAFYPVIAHDPGNVLLEIEQLSTVGGAVANVSLEVRAGEIVGLAGLVGCGKSEIGRAAFGLVPCTSGRIAVDGVEEPRPSPRRLMQRGLTYITSDRRNEGLMLLRPTKENISLAALPLAEISTGVWLKTASERDLARSLGNRLQVRPLDLEKAVIKYSGGNQQKILIAKALGRATRIFVFDEPTVGIDVAARVEVYQFMKTLIEEGAGILMISSDLPEVLNLSHRLYVVRNGRIVDHVMKPDITESRVLGSFFGETNVH
jgi:ribose transport system ATP-binding protein